MEEKKLYNAVQKFIKLADGREIMIETGKLAKQADEEAKQSAARRVELEGKTTQLRAQERDRFPREGILWPYDYFSGKEPNKVLRYDLSERSLWPSYFRLISIRAE